MKIKSTLFLAMGALLALGQFSKGADPAATLPTATQPAALEPAPIPPEVEQVAPELTAAITNVSPAEVRNGIRQATEDETQLLNMARSMLQEFSQLEANPEQYQLLQARADEELQGHEANMNSLLTRFSKGSAATKAEAQAIVGLLKEEYQLRQSIQTPSTRPATTREAQVALAKRLNTLPSILKQGKHLNRDLNYHGQKLVALSKIDDLRTASTQPSADAKQIQAKIDAYNALIQAIDQQQKAQVQVDELEEAPLPATRP